MHAVLQSLRHFYDRPYMAIGLIAFALGGLDMIYALSPEYSLRRKIFKIFFWIIYPLLLLTFFTGRKARQDQGTHILHAGAIMLVSGLLIIAALVY